MDYQTKTMVVNALTKLVDEAPTKSAVQFTLYPQTYVVTKERFDIWVKYIFSIMQIISSYVDVSICLSNINVIIMQPNSNNEYASQVKCYLSCNIGFCSDDSLFVGGDIMIFTESDYESAVLQLSGNSA